jgi:hypothetical protein
MNDTQFCQNMGLAMLWACMDGDWKHNVEYAYQVGVEAAYKELYAVNHPDAEVGDDGLPNPVYKAPLHIYNVEGVLQIDVQTPNDMVLPNADPAPPPQAEGGVVPAGQAQAPFMNMLQGMQRQQYNTLILQIHQVRQAHSNLHQHVDTQFSNLANRVFAVGVNGHARRQRQQVEEPAVPPSPAVTTNGIDPRAKLVQ